jgi:hypothetical protein
LIAKVVPLKGKAGADQGQVKGCPQGDFTRGECVEAKMQESMLRGEEIHRYLLVPPLHHLCPQRLIGQMMHTGCAPDLPMEINMQHLGI